MSDYTAVRCINQARYALTRARNELKMAMLKLKVGHATYMNCMDVEQVLCTAERELDRAVQRERLDARKEWKLRQAEEFALKSKIAKATGDSLHAAASVPETQSHK